MVPLKGFEDRYYIDEDGNVFAQRTCNAIRPYIKRNGYLQVTLYAEDGKHNEYVHRLVGKQFLPNPENKPEINHKDGNKQNNNYSNLEWSTSSENKYHAYKTGLSIPYNRNGNRNPRAKLNPLDVHVIRHILQKFPNFHYVAKLYHLSPSTVQKISNGESWNDF